MIKKDTEIHKITRNLARSRLEKIVDFGYRALKDISLQGEFIVRSEEAERYHSEFEKATLALLQASVDNDEELNQLNNDALEVDDLWYQIKSYCRTFDRTIRSSESNKPQNSCAKLPKINLPSFNGDLTCWSNYIELFKSLVHNNSNLSSIEKHQYLLSSLSDEPLRLIRQLPLVDGNYEIAFDTLTKRYQNKRILATYYWEAIVNAPTIKTRSSKQFSSLVDVFSENIAALKLLGFPTDSWDFPLFHLLLKKIDSTSRSQFEMKYSDIELPSYDNLWSFLSSEARALQTLQATSSHFDNKVRPGKALLHQSLVAKCGIESKPCSLCKTQCHDLLRCPLFQKKDSLSRFKFVKEEKRCLNCLQPNHQLRSCPSSKNCKRCKARHHTLLHFETSLNRDSLSDEKSMPPCEPDNGTPVNVLTNSSQTSSTILLATAYVGVRSVQGSYVKVRTLIDPGSQINVITERCCQRLGLRRSKCSARISGLGLSQSVPRGLTSCQIKSLQDGQKQFVVDAVILPSICSSMPNRDFAMDQWSHLRNLSLADSTFNVSGEIDMLLGAEIYSRILLGAPLRGLDHEPSAINSEFGWLVMGRIGSQLGSNLSSFNITCSDDCLGDTLKRFWTLDDIPSSSKFLSQEEKDCELLFSKNVSRNDAGRYVVPLLLKEELPSFSNTREIAVRRLYSLERKLLKDTELYEDYRRFMSEYLSSGHMQETLPPSSNNSHHYYIPHHAVIKPSSTTTKLRVVFDASSKDQNGVSLNSLLFVGPKLQSNIFDLLVRLRIIPIVLVADVKQMYRQILVDPSQTDYQRIVWRNCPSEEIRDFKLLTVTYGLSSSPFLALHCNWHKIILWSIH